MKCSPLMRMLTIWLITSLLNFAAGTDDFIAQAAKNHGEFGEKAAKFLVTHMPAADKEKLSAEFLTENLDLALKARETFPWAKEVPEEIFLNDVLPYAVFDETRETWRADFLVKATPLVKEAKTATEATQILNREFFKIVNVHYNTGRKRPNQSPSESVAQGRATCTGLSIILVDACRAVGIPARAVGTPMWSNGRGNHTWVEIWDGDWHFTGSDEYDAKGLDRGWFTGDAAQADASKPINAIYATSWKKDGGVFPMVWAAQSRDVGSVDVTARYVKAEKAENTLGVRYFLNNKRLAVSGQLVDAEGNVVQEFKTKAGTTDLNDMPRLAVVPEQNYYLQFTEAGVIYRTETFTAAKGESTRDVSLISLKTLEEADSETKATQAVMKPDDKKSPSADNAELSKDKAAEMISKTFQELVAEQKEVRKKELDAKEITIGDKKLKWLEKTFGEEPKSGRSLWISMHGGGNAPAAVNDQQWQNQIHLYQPKEGIYLAPRAPTDTWNLWHEGHIDPLFSRLIEDMVALRHVDPNKVYLMGYSAGGDGVWQLAPRMADRFAAAAMMAGHPNEATLLPLRNLPFALFVGGADGAYDRNKIVAQKIKDLDALQKADPTGYEHFGRVYEGLPHWMNGKDAEALPWMSKFTRNPWPKKIVWVQDDITHDRFYWLEIPKGSAKQGAKITATIDGQKINLQGDVPKGTRLLLSDQIEGLDLDKEIEITVNDLPARQVKAVRNEKVIREALKKRLDPAACPTASVAVFGE